MEIPQDKLRFEALNEETLTAASAMAMATPGADGLPDPSAWPGRLLVATDQADAAERATSRYLSGGFAVEVQAGMAPGAWALL